MVGPLLLLLACVHPPDGTPTTQDTASDSAVACEAIDGAPVFTRVHGALDGEVLLPWYDPVAEEAGVVVVDGEGCVRWSAATGLYPSSARWAGNHVWYNVMGPTQSLNRVDGATGEVETLDTPRGHHDFVVLEDGAVAWLEEEVRTIDGEAILGDRVRERAADGTERVVWSAFERLVLAEATTGLCDGKEPRDWTHANGMAWSPNRDAFLVSLYCTAQVVEIDRATGANLRTLDGATAASPFGPQHGPSESATGVRMFDNAGPDAGSRLLDVRWDGTITWSWSAADGLATPVLGDLLVREDGVTLASYGAEGVVLAIDPMGEEIWRIASPGRVIGRINWRP